MKGIKEMLFSTGFRPSYVVLALHLTLVVYPGCNREKASTEKKESASESTPPKAAAPTYSLEQLHSIDVPTGSIARGFCVTPDGKSAVIGGGDGSIIQVDIHGKVLRTFNGHREAVLELAITPDGQSLVSGGADNQLIVWNLRSGQAVAKKKKAHNGDIKALAISPDGALVASGAVDDTVKIWRLSSLERLHQFEGHTMSIYALVFSPDGRHVFSGARDAEVRKWSLQTGRQVGEPLRTRNSIIGMGFTPDNRTLIAGSLSNEVVFIDSNTMHMQGKRTLKSSSRLSAIDVSDDGRVVGIQRDGTLNLWDSAPQITDPIFETRLASDGYEVISFVPKSQMLITLAGDGTMVTVNRDSGELIGSPIQLPQVNGPVRASAISDTETVYAVASQGRLFTGEVGTAAREIVSQNAEVSALSFFPDSTDLLVGRSDGSLDHFRPSDGEIIAQNNPHTSAIRHLVFSADNQSLWSAADDITILQTRLQSGEVKRRLTQHTSPIRSLAVDHTGRRIASTESNNITFIYSLKNDEIEWTRRGHAIEQLSFSPDGNILAMVEDRVFIVLYNVEEREEIKRLKGSPTRITGLTYHPQAPLVLTTDVLGGVRVWSVENGAMVAAADAGRGRPRTLNLSRSGQMVMTGGMDPRGSLRIFRLASSGTATAEP